MPTLREIALKTNKGISSVEAEEMARKNDERVAERDYRANPTNPPEPPAPCKNLKGG